VSSDEPARSKWIGSTISPVLPRPLAFTMRAPATMSFTSVHGIGSIEGDRPSGCAISHSRPRLSMVRASSGSLPATST